MIIPVKKQDIFNGFTILVTVACLLTLTLNMINGRFLLGDFKVYYSAAENLFTGKQVYMVSFYTGSGFYKYSPATLFFFLPYLCFSFKTASILHFFILGGAYWYAFILIRHLIKGYFLKVSVKNEVLLLSVSFCCILVPFSRELYLGNINIILLLLCCLSIRNFLTGKDTQGGILLGFVILAKPYLLVLLLPLLLRRKWTALAWMGLTITGGIFLPFFFTGATRGISLYGGWVASIRMHSGDFPGMTSLDYFFRLLIPMWPEWGGLLIFCVISGAVAMLIIDNIIKEKQEGASADHTGMNFTYEWFLILALLPNLIRTDWVLLMFSAPILAFMIFYIASRKRYRFIPVLVLILFFYGANSDDLLGRQLSHKILYSGLMGVSNLLLVILSLFLFLDLRKRTL